MKLETDGIDECCLMIAISTRTRGCTPTGRTTTDRTPAVSCGLTRAVSCGRTPVVSCGLTRVVSCDLTLAVSCGWTPV